jgi:predicted DsbA family dithiol-disulfide isomerase
MSNKIKIDIVSDVVCPWCIIGYKRLEAAIIELKLEKQVEIEWQPFELNSDMPPEGENLRDHVLRKYGASKEDSKKTRLNIKTLAAEYGFDFNYFEEMKIVNTKDSHILLDFAHEKGLQNKLKQRLFSAFFSEKKDVSNRDILIEEAKCIGLDSTDVLAALEDNNRLQKVIAQERLWQSQGISGVPTVIFDRKSAITGAHPEETYKQILKEIINQKLKHID